MHELLLETAGGALAAGALFLALARTIPQFARVPAARAAALVTSSTAEELFWRWGVLSGLAAVLGIAPAFALATLGFALAHWRQAGLLSVRVHIGTGATFGVLYVATGNVLSPIVAHAGYNLLVAGACAGARA